MTLLGGVIEFQAPPKQSYNAGVRSMPVLSTGQVSAKPVSSHVTYLPQFSFYI